MNSRPTFPAGRGLAVALLASIAAPGMLLAQTSPDAEFKKVTAVFSEAWQKGDARGLAALHTNHAVRLAGNGQPAVHGAAAIEQVFATALTGPYKGTTLTITQNQSQKVTEDVYLTEGTYELAGGTPPAGTPMRGQFMNTVVRQDGRWLIAASAVIPEIVQK